jgi:drug/metabolite transporter (DMT)-like permease
MTARYWVLLVIGTLSSSLGGIFMKAGSVRISHDHGLLDAVFQAGLEWRIALGLLMYILPAAIWTYMLKSLEITFLQPLFSLVYVVTPVIAIFYLGEHVSAGRWAGILIVVVGIYVISRT